jgi:hypothetical protein
MTVWFLLPTNTSIDTQWRLLVHQNNYCHFGGIPADYIPVHQIDNCRLSGIKYQHQEVHQNGICWHHPLLWA